MSKSEEGKVLKFLIPNSSVYISLPSIIENYGRSIVDGSMFSPRQDIFGSDAQASIFMKCIQGLFERVYFVPMPELVFDIGPMQESFQPGPKVSSRYHIRFGSIADMRVLKGAENYAVLAGVERRQIVNLTPNLYGSGRIIPHATRKVFHYTKEAPEIRFISGTAAPKNRLPAPLITRDLQDENGFFKVRGRSDPLDALQRIRPILIPLTDYDTILWRNGAALVSAYHAYSQEVVIKARRDGRIMLVVPINMADPGSAIVEMLVTALKYSALDRFPFTVCLAPFNETNRETSLEGLVSQIGEILTARTGSTPDIYLLHSWSRQHNSLFNAIFDVALVDGQCPEAFWTVCRLTYLGLRAVVLDNDPKSITDSLPAECRMNVSVITSDLPGHVLVRDDFGDRVYASTRVSVRRILDILTRLEAEFREMSKTRKMPFMAPVWTDEHTKWLARELAPISAAKSGR